jgi:hypothetical protein
MKRINSKRRARQAVSNPLLQNPIQPPRAVRANVAVVDATGLVLAVAGTIAEVRLLLATGGAAR